jgi:hypothetical protein
MNTVTLRITLVSTPLDEQAVSGAESRETFDEQVFPERIGNVVRLSILTMLNAVGGTSTSLSVTVMLSGVKAS